MLQVWTGVECSIVRVKDAVRNQLVETGHFDRDGDLDLLAGLGVKTVRYPALWELVEAREGCDDWTWLDRRLGRLRELGISPIVGLLHHGSGPPWTHVLAPDFPDRLAAMAGRVARRYPWLEHFTPVNEPATTARMGGLYGKWIPHATDEATFLRMLAAQCRAVARTMAAIRSVIPDAQLVQTEDFGRTFATQRLEYQAQYENERRWLTLDLLCGRVDDRHPFYARFLSSGVDPRHLRELAAAPCAPNIVAVDYYLTSDRFLDHRSSRYRDETPGGNGEDVYVDVAAVRSDAPADELGLESRLTEVWERYRLPVAAGEVHNGCTRDEQLRWFMEGWQAAQNCLAKGVDVRAVTAWALFGSFDWNSLMTRQDGYYECGVFDCRMTPPRRTVVAEAVSALAHGRTFTHPALDQTGWWRRPAPSVGPASGIVLQGVDPRMSVLNECCQNRRLRTVSVRRLPPHRILDDRWATIVLSGSAGSGGGDSFSLSVRYAAGGSLAFKIPRHLDWVAACNALLDHVVDGTRGQWELVSAEAANQYQIRQAGASQPALVQPVSQVQVP
ncbi:MAG: hypothetical protein ACTHKQ_04545 [Mesorhizobium sp.]